MSDSNDFDFDDDFLSDDDQEPFDFDDEEGFPSGLGDEFESDMPEIEEEVEERGPNRTFVFLAGVMIILFVAALGIVLFLATRPTGPTDIELTASQVVMLNLTVEGQLAQTATQDAINLAMTQTAAAWTATPSPTLSSTPSDTPPPTMTASATEVRATVTPTPEVTEAQVQSVDRSTVTPTPTLLPATDTPIPPTPTDSVDLDLRSAFATQVTFATQQGQFDQESFVTRVAAATQIADASINLEGELDLRNALEATQTTLDDQQNAVQTAIAFIDQELATRSAENNSLATQLALVIPAGLQTQAALGTPFAQATVAAISTSSALATLNAGFGQPATATAAGAVSLFSDFQSVPVNAPVQDDNEQAAQTATAAVLATRQAFATQAALSTRSAVATQAAMATQQNFMTPPVFATQAAVATQNALATRQALIDLALGLGGATPTPTGGIEAVNQTATAIAGAFLTATAQAFTPNAPTMTTVPVQSFPTLAATALPQTGLFEDVVGGGRDGLGVLGLAVFGLVGVIVVSRRLRTANARVENEDPPPVE